MPPYVPNGLQPAVSPHNNWPMNKLLCFGLGYSASELASRLAPQGWQITATATSTESAARAAALGYQSIVFDGASRPPQLERAIDAATHAIVSAPPGPMGDPILSQFATMIVASPNLRWIGYLSTIGVYGDHGGAWIDETTPVLPRSERSQRRAIAESAWLDVGRTSAKTVLVFRLAGIYGPGRSALDSLLDGKARRLIKPGQVFNRIHRDDIAGLLEAAIARSPGHSIYNVCDDEPAPPQDVIAYAAHLLGLPVPPDVAYDRAPLSAMAASFYSENKRISNARAKCDLGWHPSYPTYREGLAAIATMMRGHSPV